MNKIVAIVFLFGVLIFTSCKVDPKIIEPLPINNLAESVTEDVARIKNHPLVPKDIPIYGYIYDVKTGKLIEVEAATEIGKAS